jgi:trehalose-phosphatase
MASLRSLWLSVGPLSERLCRTDSLYLGLDFDGTLTPIAPNPHETVLPTRARQVLHRLSGQEGIHLGFFSSRTLDDLQSRIGLAGVYYAGSSGLETRDELGACEIHSGSTTDLPAGLLGDLERWCQRFPGAELEPRPCSCALHYQAVAVPLQPAFGAGVRRRLRPHQPQLTLVHGRAEFEVMPGDGWNKAAAFERWLGASRPSVLPLYFGDDTRDEPVHSVVRRRRGFAVAVGRIVSRAEYALPSPENVVWFLEWLDREWWQIHSPARSSGRSHENSRV